MKSLFLQRKGAWAWFGVLFVAVGGWPSLARAGSGEANDERFQQVLILLAVVTGAYLVSYLLSTWLSRRFGLVTGVHYVALGIALGPVFMVLEPATLTEFEPIIALAVGSLGLLAGLQLNFRRLFGAEARVFKIAGLVTIMTLLLVCGLPALIMRQLWGGDTMATWMPILLGIGAIALVTDRRHLETLVEYFDAKSTATELASALSWLCTTIAVLVFGVVFCIYNPGPALVSEEFVAVQWLVMHVGVGGILGAICGAIMQHRPDEERLLTVLIGVIVLGSGIAFVSDLSIVFVNFIAGVVIINMSGESLRVHRMLAAMDRPVYIILLFVLGTSWTLETPFWVFLLVVPYIILRYLGRWSGVAFYRPRLTGSRPDPGIHRALWAPGGLAAAMILDFFGVFNDIPHPEYVITGLVAALIASEVVAHVLMRGWLIDITDVAADRRRPSRKPSLTPRGGA